MPLLTPADVCRELSIGKSTFYREVAAGRLPILKIGRATRIDRTALDHWAAQLRAGEGRADA